VFRRAQVRGRVDFEVTRERRSETSLCGDDTHMDEKNRILFWQENNNKQQQQQKQTEHHRLAITILRSQHY
jgi:hypothetical protein